MIVWALVYVGCLLTIAWLLMRAGAALGRRVL